MINISNPLGIKKGDRVKIGAKGIAVTGDVAAVTYYDMDGYDIELVNADIAGGYSHWKQGLDGGQVISVNGKEVS